jgi:hypothetical protein
MPPAAEDSFWDRLASPPRTVPHQVALRVFLSELWKGIDLASSTIGFFAAFFWIFGLVFTFLGGLYVAGAWEEDVEGVEKFLLPAMALVGPVILLSVPVAFVWAVWRRSSRKLHLMRFGKVAPATITRIWDRQHLSWRPYDEVAQQWSTFTTAAASHYAAFMPVVMAQGRNWPCKISVSDPSGSVHEITMRMDLQSQLAGPNIVVLCDPPNVNDALATSAVPRGLTISVTGRQWEKAR